MGPNRAYAFGLIFILFCQSVFANQHCVQLFEDEEYDQVAKQRQEYFDRREKVNTKVLNAPQIDFWYSDK
ncbi:MAG: hypothetical protein WCG27_07800, partial [Pseudomonadota bacterium]